MLRRRLLSNMSKPDGYDVLLRGVALWVEAYQAPGRCASSFHVPNKHNERVSGKPQPTPSHRRVRFFSRNREDPDGGPAELASIKQESSSTLNDASKPTADTVDHGVTSTPDITPPTPVPPQPPDQTSLLVSAEGDIATLHPSYTPAPGPGTSVERETFTWREIDSILRSQFSRGMISSTRSSLSTRTHPAISPPSFFRPSFTSRETDTNNNAYGRTQRDLELSQPIQSLSHSDEVADVSVDVLESAARRRARSPVAPLQNLLFYVPVADEDVPPDILLTPRIIKSLYRSVRDDKDLHRLGPDGLSSLISLLGTLSIASEPIPGVPLFESASEPLQNGVFHAPHPLGRQLLGKNNGRSHWAFVRMVAKDKGLLGMQLSHSDNYWLMIRLLNDVHGTHEVEDRRHAMSRATTYYNLLRFDTSARVNLPYLYGLLSFPLSEKVLRRAANLLLKLIEKLRGHAMSPELLMVQWEVVTLCWEAGIPEVAQNLLRVPHVESGRVGKEVSMEPRSDPYDVEMSTPIPTIRHLHALLFSSLTGSCDPYTRLDHKQPASDPSLQRWAAQEVAEALSSSSGIPNIVLLVLPTVSGYHKRYQLDVDRRVNRPPTRQGISVVNAWAIICGVLALERIPSLERPERYIEARDKLWILWMHSFPMCGAPPLVHFVILLSFIRLIRTETDRHFFSTVLKWLFHNQTVLRFPSSPVEASSWSAELSFVVIDAELSSAPNGSRDLAALFSRCRTLIPKSHDQSELVMNRLISSWIQEDLEIASELYAIANEMGIRLWRSTITAFFYCSLAERRFRMLKDCLEYAHLTDAWRQQLLETWIWNLSRNRTFRLSKQGGLALGYAIYRFLDLSGVLPRQVWRSALHLIVMSYNLRTAVKIVERGIGHEVGSPGSARLIRALPPSLLRAVANSRSKILIERMRLHLRSLRTDPIISRDGKLNPDVAFLVRLGAYYTERRLIERLGRSHVTYSPSVTNALLTRSLRAFSLDIPNSRNARYMKSIYRRLTAFIADHGPAFDPITSNLVLKAALRWSDLVDSAQMKEMFDRLLQQGYPGASRFPFGLFGNGMHTEERPSSGINGHYRISPFRHALPAYKLFIRAFNVRGDWEAARKVIGLLKDVREERDIVIRKRQAARKAGRQQKASR